jgi:23S rRNA (uracil1939-C5)-methyltransferase
MHFGTCGGCSLLEQPIAWQLHDKVSRTEALMAPVLNGMRIAYDLPERPQRYFRSRLLYPVKQDADRKAVLGIFEYRSHHVVEIEECQTQDLWLTNLGREVQGILRELRIEGFHMHRRRGIAKAFWARLASGTGEVLAGLVTRPGEFAEGQEFAAALAERAKAIPNPGRPRELVGVMHSISDRTYDFMLGDRHLPLRGRDHVVDRRDGLTFRVSAGSFYQIHSGAGALLYRPAMAMCGDVTGKTVIDGYGGVGAFGLRLAKAGAKEVLVVEDNASSCRDAEHNATENNLPQVKVLRESFTKAKLPTNVDLMIADPPRSGLQRFGVDKVLAARPKRLVYVACSPEPMALDLKTLTANGYELTGMRLCDLFPHTDHVELVASLERTN